MSFLKNLGQRFGIKPTPRITNGVYVIVGADSDSDSDAEPVKVISVHATYANAQRHCDHDKYVILGPVPYYRDLPAQQPRSPHPMQPQRVPCLMQPYTFPHTYRFP
jgi:hypothetical protein